MVNKVLRETSSRSIATLLAIQFAHKVVLCIVHLYTYILFKLQCKKTFFVVTRHLRFEHYVSLYSHDIA